MKVANMADKDIIFTLSSPKIYLNSSSCASFANFFTVIYLRHFDISITGLEDSLMKSVESLWHEASSRVPKTSLGQALLKIREKIIASGEPLLDWEDLEKEITARRGKVE